MVAAMKTVSIDQARQDARGFFLADFGAVVD
jgi:hypothetical protein